MTVLEWAARAVRYGLARLTPIGTVPVIVLCGCGEVATTFRCPYAEDVHNEEKACACCDRCSQVCLDDV